MSLKNNWNVTHQWQHMNNSCSKHVISDMSLINDDTWIFHSTNTWHLTCHSSMTTHDLYFTKLTPDMSFINDKSWLILHSANTWHLACHSMTTHDTFHAANTWHLTCHSMTTHDLYFIQQTRDNWLLGAHGLAANLQLQLDRCFRRQESAVLLLFHLSFMFVLFVFLVFFGRWFWFVKTWTNNSE